MSLESLQKRVDGLAKELTQEVSSAGVRWQQQKEINSKTIVSLVELKDEINEVDKQLALQNQQHSSISDQLTGLTEAVERLISLARGAQDLEKRFVSLESWRTEIERQERKELKAVAKKSFWTHPITVQLSGVSLALVATLIVWALFNMINAGWFSL